MGHPFDDVETYLTIDDGDLSTLEAPPVSQVGALDARLDTLEGAVSTGSDGLVTSWLDGVQLAQWTGPTLPAAVEAPWIRWGFYTANSKPRNEVVFAALRKN